MDEIKEEDFIEEEEYEDELEYVEIQSAREKINNKKQMYLDNEVSEKLETQIES